MTGRDRHWRRRVTVTLIATALTQIACAAAVAALVITAAR